jgi:hypothetical protein
MVTTEAPHPTHNWVVDLATGRVVQQACLVCATEAKAAREC